MKTPSRSTLERWRGRRLDREWVSALGIRLLPVPLIPLVGLWAGGVWGLLGALVFLLLSLLPTFPSRGTGDGVRVTDDGLAIGADELIPWVQIRSFRVTGEDRLVHSGRGWSLPFVEIEIASATVPRRSIRVLRFIAEIGPWSTARLVRELWP